MDKITNTFQKQIGGLAQMICGHLAQMSQVRLTNWILLTFCTKKTNKTERHNLWKWEQPTLKWKSHMIKLRSMNSLRQTRSKHNFQEKPVKTNKYK